MAAPFELSPQQISAIRRAPQPVIDQMLPTLVDRGVDHLLDQLTQGLPADYRAFLRADPDVREEARSAMSVAARKLVTKIKSGP